MSEEFAINYYYMGQGDCILIVCPNGQLVMIDCGSSKGVGGNNDELLQDVRTDVREVAGQNRNKIDILILTHCDRDHFNQISRIFTDPWLPIGIDTVYFSSPDDSTVEYALGKFTENRCNSVITDPASNTHEICQVFINDHEQKVMTYLRDNQFETNLGVETAVENRKHRLLGGQTPGGKPWQVSLIAGHVHPPPPARYDPNVLSLVTLLEIGGKKGLFLGDATRTTEEFLINKQTDLIRNVDFVHIPHHGSETSSGPQFVSLVNPNGAQVTHETYEDRYKHPQERVLNRWLEVLTPKVGHRLHAIDFWKEIDQKRFGDTLQSWKKEHYEILSRGGPTGPKSHYLKEPEHGYEGFIFIYQLYREYWGLWRKQTNTPLWSTGATDWMEWSLSSEGLIAK